MVKIWSFGEYRREGFLDLDDFLLKIKILVLVFFVFVMVVFVVFGIIVSLVLILMLLIMSRDGRKRVIIDEVYNMYRDKICGEIWKYLEKNCGDFFNDLVENVIKDLFFLWINFLENMIKIFL